MLNLRVLRRRFLPERVRLACPLLFFYFMNYWLSLYRNEWGCSEVDQTLVTVTGMEILPPFEKNDVSVFMNVSVYSLKLVHLEGKWSTVL